MKTRKAKKNRLAKPLAAKLPAISARDKYVLRLFVAGATVRSRQAIMHVRTLCETSLKGRVKLEVIDIYQQPGLARKNQIIATPTLIIVLPLPVRRFIGNLTTIADLFCLFDLGEKGRIVL
jgi:circadian clock protein KaiB